MRVFLALVTTALHRARRGRIRVGSDDVAVGAAGDAARFTAVERWHGLAHCLIVAEVLGLSRPHLASRLLNQRV